MDLIYSNLSSFLGQDILHLIPEVYLISSILILILFGVVYSTSQTYHFPVLIQPQLWLSVFSLGIVALLLANSLDLSSIIFSSTLKISSFTQYLKIFLVLSVIISMVISIDFLKKEKINGFEYVLLILLSCLGMMLMISSNNLIAIYLNLELQSLSFYILTAFLRNNELSTEAGLKYFIFGAFSSGILLFGLSFLYAMTGLSSLDDLGLLFVDFQSAISIPSGGIIFSFFLIFVGFLFKLYAVPFHVWVPDIYQGSPTSVTAYFATAPSIAVVGLFVRTLFDTFYDFIHSWQTLLCIVCALSMLVGCFAAIYQKNIKRLIAYSSIANVGFYLIGIAVGTPEGLQSSFFYLLGYIITMLCFFGCLMGLRRTEKNHLVESIQDLNFLYKINPLLAITLALSLFSMAGVPPLLGFFSKLYIFINLIENSLYTLFIIGVITSAISSFYYLRCIQIMYFNSSSSWTSFDRLDREKSLFISVTSLVLILFFIYPSFFILLSSKLSYLIF